MKNFININSFKILIKELLNPKNDWSKTKRYVVLYDGLNLYKISINLKLKDLLILKNNKQIHILMSDNEKLELTKALSLKYGGAVPYMSFSGIEKEDLPSISKYYPKGGRNAITPLSKTSDKVQKILELYGLKNVIKSNTNRNKIKIVKKIESDCQIKDRVNIQKEEIFVKSTRFGSLGDLLGNQFGISEDNNKSMIEYDKDISMSEKSFHKQKTKKKESNCINENIESLVLWDMENIHYWDDVSTITRYVKAENQIRVMAYSTKYKRHNYKDKIGFILKKLKKRDWIVKTTKKIADDVLINSFHQYKDKIKELVIISNDSDFNSILVEANRLKIKTIVLHRNGRIRKSHWYSKANEVLDLREI